MSIIIRLQNLPWAANSIDIRRYFAGLSIPEGGVHIVGGEKGDVFIAFGTDEDARQAMERDGGKIKDMKIKLLLSSRTEMARVIDQARNQTLNVPTPAALKTASASDSDRRKVRDRSPSPRRREKSPVRSDRRRETARSSSRRDRSRSPYRRNKDRENDRRSDRAKRDERSDDAANHYNRNSNKDFAPRDTSQDRRLYPDADKKQPQQSLELNKSFETRMGSTPQSFDSRQRQDMDMHFNQRQEGMQGRNTMYEEPMSSGSEAPSYLFPSAMNVHGKQEVKPPMHQFPGASDYEPYEKKIPGNVVANYDMKRPSPTPATSAPNVGSNSPFGKGFGNSDPYGSSMPQGYGDYPPSTYNKVQTAERGAVPAVPNERRMYHSNMPVYGAEPHARYDQIPEANQAGRNASAPREMAGHDNGPYNKRMPSNMSSGVSPGQQPTQRRSRFEPELPSTSNQFQAESASTAAMRQPSSSYANRNSANQDLDNGPSHHRERPVLGNEAPWHASGSNASSWGDDKQGMYARHLPDENMMDIDDNRLLPPVGQNAVHSSHSGRGFENRMPRHEPYNSQSSMDVNMRNTPAHEPPNSSNRPSGSPMNMNVSSCTAEVRGLPFDVSESDIGELFRGLFIPSENLKLLKSSGFGYIKFLNQRDLEKSMSRNGAKIRGSRIEVMACSLSTFESAVNEKDSHSTPALPLSSVSKLPRRRSGEMEQASRVNRESLPKHAKESPVLRRTPDVPILKTPEQPLKSQNIIHERKSIEQSAPKEQQKPMIEPKPYEPAHAKVLTAKLEQVQRNQNPPTVTRNASERIPLRKPMDVISRGRPEPPRNANSSSQGRRPNMEPCEADLCIHLKNMPYSCQNEEITNFFEGLEILDIVIETGLDNKPSGTAYVEFATPADFHAALDMSGKRIGHRYVSVVVASKDMLEAARGSVGKKPLLSYGPLADIPLPAPAGPPVSKSPAYCVRLNNLPKHTKNADISSFFGRANLIPRAIHMMLGRDKAPSGEAFAEFNTRRESDIALQQDGLLFLGARVVISPLSFQEMMGILGNLPKPNMPPPPHNDMPRRVLMPLPEPDSRPPEDHGMPDDAHNQDFPMEDMPFFEPPMGGPRPPFGRIRGAGPRPEENRPHRPPFRHGGPPPARRPPFHRHPGPGRFAGPPRNSQGPADFGRPGCVVAINNLHYRAGLDDLLSFFHAFKVDKNSVIRKYNENGQATSEARIAFNCHEDALHAVQKYHMKPILGRPISLTLL